MDMTLILPIITIILTIANNFLIRSLHLQIQALKTRLSDSCDANSIYKRQISLLTDRIATLDQSHIAPATYHVTVTTDGNYAVTRRCTCRGVTFTTLIKTFNSPHTDSNRIEADDLCDHLNE